MNTSSEDGSELRLSPDIVLTFVASDSGSKSTRIESHIEHPPDPTGFAC